MLTEVKKCIESNDIKGLHYIFVDSLDVDPTFEKYKSDYEYCKKINGFFEPYVDMTPFISSENWNEKYWVQIKMDLMKNFSEKRFSNMREVAKVIYAEKIKRLEQERRKVELYNQQVEKEQREQKARIEKARMEQQKVREATSTNIVKDNNMLAEKEQERIAKERRAIELHNQQVEKEQREQRARIEKARMEQQKAREAANSAHGNETKKDMGVVAIVAIAAIIAIILVIVLLKAL